MAKDKGNQWLKSGDLDARKPKSQKELKKLRRAKKLAKANKKLE